MLELVSEALIWIGGILVLIGTAGLLRFPDFFTRTHAATVVAVGGFTVSLLGIAILDPFGLYFVKILVVLAVNLMANPTATHALADSAYRLGIRPANLVRDDLAGHVRKHPRTHTSAPGGIPKGARGRRGA